MSRASENELVVVAVVAAGWLLSEVVVAVVMVADRIQVR